MSSRKHPLVLLALQVRRRLLAAPVAVALLMLPVAAAPAQAPAIHQLAVGRLSAPFVAADAAGTGVVLTSRARARGPQGRTRPGQGDEASRRIYGALVSDGRVGSLTALPVPQDSTLVQAAVTAPDGRPPMAVVGSGNATSVVTRGGVGWRTALETRRGTETVFAAADPGGPPVAAWIPALRDRVVFAVERADGTLSARRSVALTGLATTESVAVDAAAGRLWVGWLRHAGEDDDRLMIRSVPLQAAQAGSVREIARLGSVDVALHVQATRTGAVVGWTATAAGAFQTVAPGDPCVDTCSIVAAVGPDAASLGRVTVPGATGIALAAGSQGTFAAVRHPGGQLGIMRITPGGVIHDEVPVAGGPADTAAPDVPSEITLLPRPSMTLVASHGGGFVLAWATRSRPSGLRVAFGASDGTTGSPLAVTPAGGSVAGIGLTLGPRPLVVWRAFRGHGRGGSFATNGSAVLAARELPRPRSCGCSEPPPGGGGRP